MDYNFPCITDSNELEVIRKYPSKKYHIHKELKR